MHGLLTLHVTMSSLIKPPDLLSRPSKGRVRIDGGLTPSSSVHSIVAPHPP